MCGLIGSIGFKDEALLDPKILYHRGPDGIGLWVSPDNEFPVAFGHTRLAILDLSKSGDQPLFADNGRYVFVFNGEIYNFIELRSELESLGQVFYTQTDTEVFLKGLILEGPSFQLRCNGMWSFCLWDRLKKSALFGRDRFGKKPLFYSWLRPGEMVFSSEMKGIYPFLKSIQPSEKINIHLQRLFDYESSEECVVAGIKRLPPGHYAEFKNRRFEVRRWWNTLDHLIDVPASYEEQVEKWRDIFLDSVRIRMRSDVCVGTALSGGLDSSAIFSAMAYLAKQSGSHIREAKDWQHGFCAHFPYSSIDEVKWAKMVTDAIGVPLHAVTMDPLMSGWSILDALYQVEDPYLTLPLPMLALYRAIADKGIKVTLDGHGADELFSGYGNLNAAFKQANPVEAAELTVILNGLSTGQYNSYPKNIYGNWIKQRLIYFLKTHFRQTRSLVTSIFGRGGWDLIHCKLEFPDQEHPQFKGFDSLTKSLYEIFHVTILPTLLRNYDRYSMASGVEVRMPFMDYRLVSYTFSLPWTCKVGGTFTKRIMRDSLKGILPEGIRTRRDKIGWNAPLHEWLRGPLKREIEMILGNGAFPKDLSDAWHLFQKKPNS